MALLTLLREKPLLGIAFPFFGFIQNYVINIITATTSMEIVDTVSNLLSFIAVLISVIVGIMTIYVRRNEIKKIKEEKQNQ